MMCTRGTALLLLTGVLAAAAAPAVAGRRDSLYDGARLVAETATSALVQPPIAHEYVWFGDRPVAQYDAATGSLSFTFTDQLGAPVLQTGATGDVIWRAEYEPYGAVHSLRAGAQLRQPLRLPGQEAADVSSDRSYNIHRWYRPTWSLYTQRDPVGDDGETHPYLYVAGRPLTAIDPLGLYHIQSATEGQAAAIRRAMEVLQKLLEDEDTKSKCDPCRDYFRKQAAEALRDLDSWTREGGPPYIRVETRPSGVGSRTKAASRRTTPYMIIYDDNFLPRSMRDCELASLILHEAGHLARQDTGDNEPAEFFKKCRIDCVDPGRFK